MKVCPHTLGEVFRVLDDLAETHDWNAQNGPESQRVERAASRDAVSVAKEFIAADLLGLSPEQVTWFATQPGSDAVNQGQKERRMITDSCTDVDEDSFSALKRRFDALTEAERDAVSKPYEVWGSRILFWLWPFGTFGLILDDRLLAALLWFFVAGFFAYGVVSARMSCTVSRHEERLRILNQGGGTSPAGRPRSFRGSA